MDPICTPHTAVGQSSLQSMVKGNCPAPNVPQNREQLLVTRSTAPSGSWIYPLSLPSAPKTFLHRAPSMVRLRCPSAPSSPPQQSCQTRPAFMEVLHRKQHVVPCVNMWEPLCWRTRQVATCCVAQARDPGAVGEADLGPLQLLFQVGE